VRFDDVPVGRGGGGHAEIGVTVAPEQRGAGWAAALIDAGCRALERSHGAVEVVARIRPGNARSVRSFESAGFLASRSAPEWLEYRRPRDE
jgi:RimJ/RimL family protein N-acetyltransferase